MTCVHKLLSASADKLRMQKVIAIVQQAKYSLVASVSKKSRHQQIIHKPTLSSAQMMRLNWTITLVVAQTTKSRTKTTSVQNANQAKS